MVMGPPTVVLIKSGWEVSKSFPVDKVGDVARFIDICMLSRLFRRNNIDRETFVDAMTYALGNTHSYESLLFKRSTTV
jgi:hypothetical protein